METAVRAGLDSGAAQSGGRLRRYGTCRERGGDALQLGAYHYNGAGEAIWQLSIT